LSITNESAYSTHSAQSIEEPINLHPLPPSNTLSSYSKGKTTKDQVISVVPHLTTQTLPSLITTKAPSSKSDNLSKSEPTINKISRQLSPLAIEFFPIKTPSGIQPSQSPTAISTHIRNNFITHHEAEDHTSAHSSSHMKASSSQVPWEINPSTTNHIANSPLKSSSNTQLSALSSSITLSHPNQINSSLSTIANSNITKTSTKATMTIKGKNPTKITRKFSTKSNHYSPKHLLSSLDRKLNLTQINLSKEATPPKTTKSSLLSTTNLPKMLISIQENNMIRNSSNAKATTILNKNSQHNAIIPNAAIIFRKPAPSTHPLFGGSATLSAQISCSDKINHISTTNPPSFSLPTNKYATNSISNHLENQNSHGKTVINPTIIKASAQLINT